MPTAHQNTVQTRPGANGTLGSINGISRSNKASLDASFDTPSWISDGDAAAVLALQTRFQALVIDDVPRNQNNGGDFSAAAGVAHYGLPTFSREFSLNINLNPEGAGAFAYADVTVGAGGLPGSAWTPNTASPGEGNGADPTKLPAPPLWMSDTTVIATKQGQQWGSGEGSVLDTAASSANIDEFLVNGEILGYGPSA